MSIFFGALLAVFADGYDLKLEVFIAIMTLAIVGGVVLCIIRIKRNSRVVVSERSRHNIRPLTEVDFNAAWAKAKNAVSEEHVKLQGK